jgi:hypothetical protein
MIESGARDRGATAEERLLAIYDVLGDVFSRADREARAMVETLGLIAASSPMNAEVAESLADFRTLVSVLATEAGLSEVEEFGLSWRILMNGMIAKTIAGDQLAPSRTKEMARDLVARHRTATVTAYPVTQVYGDNFALDFDSFYDLGHTAASADVPDVSRGRYAAVADAAEQMHGAGEFDGHVSHMEAFRPSAS